VKTAAQTPLPSNCWIKLATSKQDKDMAEARYRAMVKARKVKK
jgi:hypothetical protein